MPRENLDLKKALLLHYKSKGIFSDTDVRRFFAVFVSGRNPFADQTELTMIIARLKTAGFGKFYLSNAYLDLSVYLRLWEETPTPEKEEGQLCI